MVARTLGTPLMPWQQLAADVALERNPDGSYHYPIVVISVPRQSGKTTLLRAIAVQKMMSHRNREVYYTAQTGKDATARWLQLVEAIETNRSAGQMFAVRKSAGSSWIMHRRTRSKFMPFAPTAESLHGYTPHDVMLDEAFHYNEVQGRMIMGAIVPAQSTIRDRQLYIVSTKGTAESTFLNDWIERGRAGEPGVALIEYAAAPGEDAYSPATWRKNHPALGISITEDTIAHAAKSLTRSEFERAYANRQTLTLSSLVPQETWEPLKSKAKATTRDAVALTYDVEHDLTSATIVLSWVARSGKYDGMLHHRILEHHAGVEWLADSVQNLAAELRPAVVGADDGGPARGITAELRRRGIDVQTTSAPELATAYGRWMTRIRSDRLRHDGRPEFWLAVAAMATRPMGDAVAPSRRYSAAGISPAVAAMVAGILLEQLAPPAPAPFIYIPGESA